MSIGKIKRETLENAATMIREKLAGSDEANEGILPSQIAIKIDHVATHNYERGYRNGENAIIPIKRQLEAKVFGEVRDGALADSVGQAVSDFEAIRGEIIAKGVILGAGRPTEEYADKVGEVYTKGENAGYERGNADGAAEGYENGKAAGHEEGYNEGFSTGKSEGYNSGYQIGKVDGKAEGYENGKAAGREEGYNDGFSTGKAEGVTLGREEGREIGYAEGGAARENELKGEFFGIFEAVGVELPCNPTINDSFGEIREGIADALERKDKGVELYWTDKDGSISGPLMYEHPFVKTIKAPESIIISYEVLDKNYYRIELLGDVEIYNTFEAKVLELYNKLGTLSKDQLMNECYVEVRNLYSDAEGESKISQDEQGFVWYVDDDVVYLCDYRGKSKDVILPESYKGREYSLWELALSGLRIDYIHIPKDKKTFTSGRFVKNPFGNDIYIVIDNPSDWCEKIFSSTNNNPMALGARLSCNGEIIKSITVPEEILKVGVAQFYYNKDIETVILHDKITEISNYAFSYCVNIKSITIPDGVTTISSNAFYNSGLESFVFPKNITNLGQYIFYACASLKTITIYGSTLSKYMCRDCLALTDIIINDDITTVENYTFSGCSSITNVTVNGTIKLSNNNLSFSASSLLTVESMVSIINSLVSLVGSTQRTVYFGSTNLAKLTAEQKAIATNKNIKLA